MKYRKLGNSGLFLSEISLGTWLNCGGGFPKKKTFDILMQAINHGCNYFDTADVYQKGEAEMVLGEFFKKNIGRQNIIIGTKVFGPQNENWMHQGLSFRHINNSCKASLQRLQTDYIDIYQCHRFDVNTPLEEVCFTMDLLIKQGHIRYWGVSEWSSVQILNTLRVCEKNNFTKPISNQVAYHLFNRTLEIDLLDTCETEGIGILVYSPLAQGILTGKYISFNTNVIGRINNLEVKDFFPFDIINNHREKLVNLFSVAEKANLKLSHLSLSWCLRIKSITSLVTGASDAKNIEENFIASEINIEEELINAIEEIVDNAPINQYTGKKIGYNASKISKWLLPHKTINH